eukprot:g15811.t1
MSTSNQETPIRIADDPVVDREHFVLHLLRELSTALETAIGLDDARGFISLIGQQVGDKINERTCRELSVSKLSSAQISKTLVQLKDQIDGDFYVIEEGENRIVLGNRQCPFGEYVEGRESLCMMTSNVFGRIAAQNLGYAKVDLEETIARGHPGCRVTLYLHPDDERASDDSREYFQS